MKDARLDAVVVGYGSIGRRHVEALASRAGRMIVVDADPAARAAASRAHPRAEVFSSAEEVRASHQSLSGALGVIATWGPSHLEIFQHLLDLKVQAIVCEKPLAASVANAHRMCDAAARAGTPLAVNHIYRYLGLRNAVRGLEERHALGEPIALVSLAGAAGLITNGIHVVDFAFELFDGAPRRVVSTAQSDPVNPRSSELNYFGGTSTFEFDGRREATLAYTNLSSLALWLVILYREALIEVDSNFHYVIRRRESSEVQADPRLTRYGVPHEVDRGTLNLHPDPIRRSHDDALAGADTAPGWIGRDVLGACIASLVSAESGRAVVGQVEPDSEWGRRQWAI